jgi:hypothetical protein
MAEIGDLRYENNKELMMGYYISNSQRIGKLRNYPYKTHIGGISKINTSG